MQDSESQISIHIAGYAQIQAKEILGNVKA
jgi:hypothetical protein